MDSKKELLLALLQQDPFIGQQALAERLGLSRSAVAGHIAALTREGRILGRAYVLPQQAPVLCIGGANIDRKLRTLGALQMGSSNPAVMSESLGGVARNVAENLARLGLPTQLITAVGEDAAGQALLAQAAAVGLSTQGTLRAADAPTGSYTAVLDAAGEMQLALAAMPLAERLDPEFLRRSCAQRQQARLIVLDLNLPAESIALLLREAQENPGRRLLAVAVSEAKMRHLPAQLQGLTTLLLNRGELAALLGHALPAHDPQQPLPALAPALAELHARGLPQLVLSLGEAGLICSEAGQTPQHLRAPAVPVCDVTGAGDALAAGVCAGLLQAEASLASACRLGLRLAALTVQSPHTVHPELSPALLQEPEDFTKPHA
ncbi:MAG: PfkB family carbohydrate kinase [Paucibacter sp.]|nr:PfkB family carbohydrate kinase [Roseateles sp.]